MKLNKGIKLIVAAAIGLGLFAQQSAFANVGAAAVAPNPAARELAQKALVDLVGGNAASQLPAALRETLAANLSSAAVQAAVLEAMDKNLAAQVNGRAPTIAEVSTALTSALADTLGVSTDKAEFKALTQSVASSINIAKGDNVSLATSATANSIIATAQGATGVVSTEVNPNCPLTANVAASGANAKVNFGDAAANAANSKLLKEVEATIDQVVSEAPEAFVTTTYDRATGQIVVDGPAARMKSFVHSNIMSADGPAVMQGLRMVLGNIGEVTQSAKLAGIDAKGNQLWIMALEDTAIDIVAAGTMNAPQAIETVCSIGGACPEAFGISGAMSPEQFAQSGSCSFSPASIQEAAAARKL